MFLTDKTFNSIELTTNTLLHDHLIIDARKLFEDSRWLIYDAVTLIYLYNIQHGCKVTRYAINKIFIKGIQDKAIHAIDGKNYEQVMKEKLKYHHTLMRKAIIFITETEYSLRLTAKEKKYLFKYAKPLEIVKTAIDNELLLPQVIVDTYNNIITGKPLDADISINYSDIISNKAREDAKKKRISERVQDEAEVYIYRELAKRCTCLYEDLAAFIAPTVLKQSLETIRRSRKYSNKSDEQLLKDENLKADVLGWCEQKTLHVFRETPIYSEAKTRIRGDRKNYIPPAPCRVHAK